MGRLPCARVRIRFSCYKHQIICLLHLGITCPDLDDLEHGDVTVNGNVPGSRADYNCDSGYMLEGVAWRKCQENGEWSGQAPMCESKDKI